MCLPCKSQDCAGTTDGPAKAGTGASAPSRPSSQHAQERILRLARAFRTQRRPAGDLVSAGQGLVEPLAARDLEVLRFLSAGGQNRDITEQLVVTRCGQTPREPTFDALGADKRTEAVARASKLHPIR